MDSSPYEFHIDGAEAAASAKVDTKSPKLNPKPSGICFNHQHMNKSWKIITAAARIRQCLDLFFINVTGVNDWLMRKTVEINQQ